MRLFYVKILTVYFLSVHLILRPLIFERKGADDRIAVPHRVKLAATGTYAVCHDMRDCE